MRAPRAQDMDLVVGNQPYRWPDYSGQNELYVNDGFGGFTPLTTTPITADERSNTLALAWADIDDDGDLDLAVGNEDGPNLIYRNNGQLSFTELNALGGDTDTYALAFGDVDGDGDMDLAVGNSGANQLWANDGNGFFSPVTTTPLTAWNPFTGTTSALAFGDMDGDGVRAAAPASARFSRTRGTRAHILVRSLSAPCPRTGPRPCCRIILRLQPNLSE